MTLIEFLKYFLDTHPITSILVALILAGGISELLSNIGGKRK
jgi:hypothetical protein